VSTANWGTVGELLAESDELARETLLDATPDQAPAMVRSWKQLVGSAAELWAVVPAAPDSPSDMDPMERLRAVGEAIGRSVTAGHWPGQGPTDERLMQIADNLSRARHLVEPHGRRSQQAALEMQRDIQDLHGQVMHTLYVAVHGTAVALGAHVTDLQHRLAAGGRRRQPLAERPTLLEITAAQGMIARFDGFEQLAGVYLFGLPPTSAKPDQVREAAPATRLETALAAWEVQAHRSLANNPDPADLVRVARVQALMTSTTSVLTEAAARKGPYRRRCSPATGAGAGGQPGGMEPRGEALGRTHQPSQPHRPRAGRRSQRGPRRVRGRRYQSDRMGHPRSARQLPRPSRSGQDTSSQHGRLRRHRLRRPGHRGRSPRSEGSGAHHRHEGPGGG
jgi:hypothetical protein